MAQPASSTAVREIQSSRMTVFLLAGSDEGSGREYSFTGV
jgi:hypothetical protein